MSRLIQNAVRITEDGRVTYLVSAHRYDFVTYQFKDGASYSIDGGKDYRKICSNLKEGNSYDIINYSLDENSDFETEIVTKLIWGTNGKNGDEELSYKPLISLTRAHLTAILKTQEQIKGTIYEKVIKHILKEN